MSEEVRGALPSLISLMVSVDVKPYVLSPGSVVVVALSSLVRSVGECSTIHSRPELFSFFF